MFRIKGYGENVWGVLSLILWVEVNWVYISLLLTLIDLTLPHFCACSKSGPGFPTSYVMVFYVQWVQVYHDFEGHSLAYLEKGMGKICEFFLPMIFMVEVNLVYIRLLLTLNDLTRGADPGGGCTRRAPP